MAPPLTDVVPALLEEFDGTVQSIWRSYEEATVALMPIVKSVVPVLVIYAVLIQENILRSHE